MSSLSIDISTLSLEGRRAIEAIVAAEQSREQSTEPFTAFICSLNNKLLVRPVGVPSVDVAKSILGLNLQGELIARSAELSAVVGRVDFHAVPGGRKPLNLVSGIPGVGKTRMLVEVAQVMAPRNVVAVTFNNAHTISHAESELFRHAPELPVVLRLLHGYLFTSYNWTSFFASAKELLPASMGLITLGDCLDHLCVTFQVPQLLLLVDECLRGLDAGMTAASTEEMVRSVCVTCDGAGRSAVFSAMATSFLSELVTESARPIATTTLLPLSAGYSLALTAQSIPEVARLAQHTDLDADDVIATLDALAVAGLPRAAEFLKLQLGECDWINVPAPLATIVSAVLRQLSERYSLPRSLAHLCVLGTAAWGMNTPIPGTKGVLRPSLLKAREAVLRGWLPQPPPNSQVAGFNIPPAMVLSSLFKAPATGADQTSTRRAEVYFAGLLALRPRDLWEEFVMRLLILRSHLEVASVGLRKKKNKLAPAPVPSPGLRMLFSVFDLFNGAVRSGPLTHAAVLVAEPLSNMVLLYGEKSPPTPHDLATDPSIAQHILASESPREPGVDMLLFVRAAGAQPREPTGYIAVGLQCKWSDLQSVTTLTLPILREAHKNFLSTMTARGWQAKNTLLIFLAHRPVTSGVVVDGKLTPEVPPGVAVAGLRCGIEKWLGPSLTAVAERLHDLKISHGPYAPFVPPPAGTET